MSIAVVGIDHTTCPVMVRERTVLDSTAEVAMLEELHDCESLDEAVIVSTCARTEIYISSQSRLQEALVEVTTTLIKVNAESEPYIWNLDGREAVCHAFRVTAGLESQVLGEAEITGQVRGAVQSARSHGTLGPNLDSLFRSAVACSRRLRRETSLGDSDASVASAAVSLYEQDHSMSDSQVLIIGSGKIARMLAKEFSGAKRIAIAARTHAGAQSLAERSGAESIPFPLALQTLKEFDVVCCATRSRQPLITKELLYDAGPLVLFDVSIPRNIEPSSANILGVRLYDIDGIRSIDAIPHIDFSLVQSVIDSEIHHYLARENQKDVGPIIESLRTHVERVRAQEIERIGTKLDSFDSRQRAIVETLTQRLIDRMFHHLVIRLKLAALSDPELIKAADFFFAHGQDSLFPEPSREQIEEPANAI